MDGGTVFWIVVGVISWGIIILALVNSHKNKDNPDAMKFMVRLLHRLGIDGYPSGQEIVIWGFANKLEVCYRKNKKDQKIEIDANDITNISTFYEWQEKGNTQIKNAIIGGIIAGGAGAIVGSNLKNIKNKEYKFLSIKYIGEEGIERMLVFNGLNMMDSWVNSFINDYKKYVSNNSEIVTLIE